MYQMLKCARGLQMQPRALCIGILRVETIGLHKRIARISPTSGEISQWGFRETFVHS
jgi:hypothetical protein